MSYRERTSVGGHTPVLPGELRETPGIVEELSCEVSAWTTRRLREAYSPPREKERSADRKDGETDQKDVPASLDEILRRQTQFPYE
jgi:hypothetical protein